MEVVLFELEFDVDVYIVYSTSGLLHVFVLSMEIKHVLEIYSDEYLWSSMIILGKGRIKSFYIYVKFQPFA